MELPRPKNPVYFTMNYSIIELIQNLRPNWEAHTMRLASARIETLLIWLLSIAFAASVAAKLSGAPEALGAFKRFGLPEQFVLITIIVEAIGVFALHWRKGSLGLVGPGLLFATMAVATTLHLIHDTFGQALPALVLLLLTTGLFSIRAHRLARKEVSHA